MSEGDENVKVAVRVRPFNKREIGLKAKCIIRMEGSTTHIKNPETGKDRDYTFDYSYWSHDPADGHFAGQVDVFNDLGIGVLANAEKGYNVSLFAYGQTGSGKSYSMVGYGEDKGIIPLVCEELFKRVEKNADENLTLKVEASMLEIYNESVRDLFNPAKGSGLRVRENPKTGPYVEGLAVVPASSYAEISRLMDEGTAARTVASTNMNATSSRAHTIFTIIFTQEVFDPEVKKKTQKVSKMSLVDLAGSERANSTGATGDRLKEGANINKSLSALGNCISALAENSDPSKKSKHVPYRDSVLTWLLKESLGGNAKTIMIAAVSPADVNFDESLSTLRYADRAKQIKNKAIVNEDANAKIIRELKSEIEKLKQQLGAGGGGGGSQPGSARMDPMVEEELRKLREQFEESQNLIQKLTMSEVEKKKQLEEFTKARSDALRISRFGEGEPGDTPHLTNLNEDLQLSESLFYFIADGKSMSFGRRTKDHTPDVALASASIRKVHCIFTTEEGCTYAIPGEEGAKIIINGQKISEKTPIHHNDRVILGDSCAYKFVHPIEKKEKSSQKADEEGGEEGGGEEGEGEEIVIDWDFAMREAAEVIGRSLHISQDEGASDELIEKMRAELEEERKKQELEVERQRKELEEKEKAMMQQIMSKEEKEELEKARQALEEKNDELQRQLEQQENIARELANRHAKEKRERTLLDEALIRVIPMVNEANQIADELEKDIRFDIHLVSKLEPVGDHTLPEEMRYQRTTTLTIPVKAKSDDSMIYFVWTPEAFEDRVYMMREMYQNYLDAVELGSYMEVSEEDDPFFENPEPQLIGTANVFVLTFLYHFLEFSKAVPIYDYKGLEHGTLNVEIRTCDKTGNSDPDTMEEYTTDTLRELIGCRFDFRIALPKAMGISKEFSKNIQVTFRFPKDGKKYLTSKVEKTTINPVFRFDEHIVVDPVTEDFLNCVENDSIEFSVFGEPVSSTLKGGIKVNADAADGVASAIVDDEDVAGDDGIQDDDDDDDDDNDENADEEEGAGVMEDDETDGMVTNDGNGDDGSENGNDNDDDDGSESERKSRKGSRVQFQESVGEEGRSGGQTEREKLRDQISQMRERLESKEDTIENQNAEIERLKQDLEKARAEASKKKGKSCTLL